MKTKINLLLLAWLFTGCLTPANYDDPAYVEQKAYRVSERVTVKLLTDKPASRPKFEQAYADLQYLEGKTNTTLADVLEIVQRVPRGSAGKNAFWVETGLLFIEDDLSRIGVRNPALVLPTVTGLRRGVGEGLAKTKP